MKRYVSKRTHLKYHFLIPPNYGSDPLTVSFVGKFLSKYWRLQHDELPPSTNHHTRLQQETSSRGWRENMSGWFFSLGLQACMFQGQENIIKQTFIVMICGSSYRWSVIVPFLLLFFEEMQLWYNLQGYPLRFFEARTSTSSPKAHPMISCI